MEPSPVQTTPSVEEDEWDTDGFVIPSLGIEDPEQNRTISPRAEDSKLSEVKARKEENIYLGPHGAPPSQAKQQEHNSSSRKQKFKHKLKEADKRYSGTGRENKVDNLRELVGGGKMPVIASKSSPREWLDPHCHESQFERRHLH
ncbi:hypothetical protein Salat_2034600 [Sesamum alatum]|uniref:Uncharacterized protein n=1 Tax=Sesamum alatum TaxID=300844 RepID=A0AAE1Y073_9LAMI|nr:hypothetical protein Salat_2034600 [Sesamum alatum]